MTEISHIQHFCINEHCPLLGTAYRIAKKNIIDFLFCRSVSFSVRFKILPLLFNSHLHGIVYLRLFWKIRVWFLDDDEWESIYHGIVRRRILDFNNMQNMPQIFRIRQKLAYCMPLWVLYHELPIWCSADWVESCVTRFPVPTVLLCSIACISGNSPWVGHTPGTPVQCTNPWTTRAPSRYKDVISRYGNFHYKDKTVARPSYLYTGNTASLYWDGPDPFQYKDLPDWVSTCHVDNVVNFIEYPHIRHTISSQSMRYILWV